MIDRPGLVIGVEPAEGWSAEGPLADRALGIARRVAERLAGPEASPLRIIVERAAPEHAGLGTGTQLALGVARVVARALHRDDWADLPVMLATLADRRPRSAIGLHGFERGGLIVDGGHPPQFGPPPLVASAIVPPEWSILIVLPRSQAPGLHGPAELLAFAKLPAFPIERTDRLCRLVLLGVLPAVAEGDLQAFGHAIESIQDEVGRAFAPAQGGSYAHPMAHAIIDHLRALGFVGVGQSSWGPALYAFTDEADPQRRDALLADLNQRIAPAEIDAFWTTASPGGAIDLE